MDRIRERFDDLKHSLRDAPDTPSELRRLHDDLARGAQRLLRDITDETGVARVRRRDIEAGFGFREKYLDGRLGGDRRAVATALDLRDEIADLEQLEAEVEVWAGGLTPVMRQLFITATSRYDPTLAALLTAGNIMVEGIERSLELQQIAVTALRTVKESDRTEASLEQLPHIVNLVRAVNVALDDFQADLRELGFSPFGLRGADFDWHYIDSGVETLLSDLWNNIGFIRRVEYAASGLLVIRHMAEDLERAFVRDADEIAHRVGRMVDQAWDAALVQQL
jgi:hypothetical protein